MAAEEISRLAAGSVDLAETGRASCWGHRALHPEDPDLVQEIAAASSEQYAGVGQINGAIGQISQADQQNAAASEELASTSEELGTHAEQLQRLMAQFQIDASAPGAATERAPRGACRSIRTLEALP